MTREGTGGLSADLEKSFPGGPRVRAALTVPGPSGPVTILFGPSGVGKTTVLRCLAGLERPTRGRIVFDGDIWSDTERGLMLSPQKRPVGYLSQDYALFPHLTVRENIAYNLGRVSVRDGRERVEHLMRILGIESLGPRRPQEISGGQQQRVGLARALARNPKLLLLDEPLSALDLPTRGQVRAELGRLLRGLGIPVVVITHDWVEALTLGDDLAVMGREGILQTGPPQEVFTRPAHLEVAEAVGVETIVPSRVVQKSDGMILLQAGQHRISVVDPRVGESEFYLCLRGEDVLLEKGSAPRSSARNHLTGRVSEISAYGPMKKVVVDVGFSIVALVTRQAAEDLALGAGEEVAVVFKASAAHLIPR